MMPLTYLECRAQFHHAAIGAGARLSGHHVDALGPHGEQLTIDVAVVGEPLARHVLMVWSGVHGVEGFAGSMLQRELLHRLTTSPPARGVAVVLVHAVNPYGMAWWRRQNESNVDLNRNWNRDQIAPERNAGYDELHHLLCPTGAEVPTPESLLVALGEVITARGIAWVRSAVTAGQYHHADGLYFGGDRTERSTQVIETFSNTHLDAAERVVIIDLHTGHGARGTYTLLSDAPLGSPQDRWLRANFDASRVETTVDNPDATTPPKRGQLAAGLASLRSSREHHAITFELGTVANTRMIVAERAEHWAHRYGKVDDAGVRAARLEHRVCSAPDDPQWERTACAHGRTVIDAALELISS